MEGWAAEFDERFGTAKRVAGPNGWGYSRLHENYKDFIRILIAKERESAERRGREKAVEYIKRRKDYDYPFEKVLEAARKDTDV